MSSKGEFSLARFIIIISFITIFFLVLYVPPAIDFSAANPFWNGYSTFCNRLDVTIIDKPLSYPIKEPRDTILITIPYIKYFNVEIENLKRFVREGGVLIILDDYGYSNQILNSLGGYVTVVNDVMLVDPLFNYRNGRFPKIIDFSDDREVENITEVIFNHASALYVSSPKVKVLAYSSSFSFLDTDFNGRWDEGENKGSFPVMAKFPYGSGTVYVISDPSFLLNSMIDMGDNYKLILNLIDNKKVLLDQYHLRINMHYQIRKYIIALFDWIFNPVIFPYITTLFIFVVLLMFVRVIVARGVGYG